MPELYSFISIQFKWKYPGVFRFLGRNSYEIYLTHMFVVYVLFKMYREQGLSGEWAWGLYITTILLSGFLGEMVARFISNPANKYLRKQLVSKQNTNGHIN